MGMWMVVMNMRSLMTRDQSKQSSIATVGFAAFSILKHGCGSGAPVPQDLHIPQMTKRLAELVG